MVKFTAVSYPGTIRQCLMSAPGDMASDLQIVHREIIRWNGGYGRTFRTAITPVIWNINAAAEYGASAQDAINKQLVDPSDMGIALFGTRLGTRTKNAKSGTAEEIERLAAAGKPVGVLRSRRPVDITTVNLRQAKALENYLNKLSANGLLMDYKDDAELITQVDNFIRWVVASDEGVTPIELEQTRAADVWPRIEPEDGSNALVLVNLGNAPAHHVRVRLEPIRDNDLVWAIIRTWAPDEPDIEILAPNGTVRIPFLASLAAAPQVRCIVTFTDDRGEQTNTATVRLS